MPYYWDPQQQISLPVPAGGMPGGGYGGGGGLFGGLMGGGQPQYGGLIGAAGGGLGNTDALMEALIRRQLEQSMRPDFSKMAAAFAQAAMPSRYPIPMGAALGMAAGAMSAGDTDGTKALQSLKMLQELQLAKRKAGWIDKFLADEGTGGTGQAIRAALAPSLPGVTPLSSTGRPAGGTVPPKPLIPRVPLSDVTTGDLSPSYGEVPTDETTTPGDAELGGGGGTPAMPARPQAALTGSAWEVANNNFGGLRKPGVIAGPSQGGFQSFATPAEGVAAISNQLDRYASGATTGKPLTTIRQIVSTWAPPHENPTEALIARASRIVGADPDAPLDVSNPQVKAKLIEATIANEQGGRVPVARDLISRVAASNAAPTASSSVSIPPPRLDPNAWYNQPVTRSVFRDPSVDPGSVPAAERLRQSILGSLAGGSPIVDPSQSPTAAVRGGLPPQDEVISSGNRPALPGLLQAQYSTVPGVDPSQSPAVALGGGAPTPPVPPPAAPGAPMAPGQPQPGVTIPTVPTPGNLDPTKIQNLMVDLARKSAMAEALGLPNVYGPMIQVLQNSPQYKAMVEHATEGAKLPFQYAQPQYNLPLQTQLETMKQQAAALGKWLSPEADVALQKAMKEAEQAAILKREQDMARFNVDPNAIGAPSAAPQQTGPGYSEPLPTKRGTIIPPHADAAPIVGSPKELEQRQTGKGGWAETQSEWNNNLTALRKVQQTALAVADVMKSYQTGSFAGELSDIRAKLKAVGIHLPESIAGDPAAAQKIIKDNFSQTITSLKGFDANPAVYQIKLAFENWANTNLQPEANLSILSKAVGTSEWQEQMVHDFAEAKKYGWRDPGDFMRAWGARPENSLQAFIDRASQKIGPLAGAPQSPSASGLPTGVPQGSKQIGTFNGDPVFELPDGSRKVLRK